MLTRHSLLISVWIVSFASSLGYGQEVEPGEAPREVKLELDSARRNQPLEISWRGGPAVSRVEVAFAGRSATYQATAQVDSAADPPRARFLVPMDIPAGSYRLHVTFFDDQDVSHGTVEVATKAAGPLRILADSILETPVLESALPPVVYADDDAFDFDLIGRGFSTFSRDIVVLIDGQGEYRVVPPDVKELGEGEVRGRLLGDRQLRILGLPAPERSGTIHVRVRVGDAESAPIPLVLAHTGKWTPLIVALVAVAVLLAIVLLVAKRGVRNHKIGDTTYGLLSLMLLDKETDTYSLSRFQLYLWTFAAVFGYVYLTIARSLIQGVFEFAPIPTGLPGILAVSAGTAVVAQGAAVGKGPKGAGNELPSLADLVTTGGVVVAERFQFLVWTLLGSAAFLFLVIGSDPGSIEALPTVPQGFLYLMGISSAGYLGGKLARKPGPIVDEIVAEKTGGNLKLQVHGRNLSPDAQFLIGDVSLTQKLGDQGRPQNAELPEQPNSTEFFKLLKLEIAQPDTEWLKGAHQLTVVNPDGQRAVWKYTGPDPA